MPTARQFLDIRTRDERHRLVARHGMTGLYVYVALAPDLRTAAIARALPNPLV